MGDVSNHPYLPKDISLPDYVENDKSNVTLLVIFFGIISIFPIALYKYSGRLGHLENRFLTRLKLCWFLCCGFIHLFLEGYYVLNYRTLSSDNSFLAQIWKEYSKCDSRYIIGDSFTVCMESITAFIDGPLAFYTVYLFLGNRSSRFVVQLIVSICQLYGDSLYFSTEYLDDFKHGPYNHPLYFWFYFFFMNILWIIIPFICIVESYLVLSKASLSYDVNKKGK